VEITPIVGDLDRWQVSKSISFDLDSVAGAPVTYQVIFRVQNNNDGGLPFGVVGNPAGFLADLKLSGYLSPPTPLLSSGGSDTWQWATDAGKGVGAVTTSTITSLTWSNAVAWDYSTSGPTGNAYNGGNNIWGYQSGLIPSISTSAQWIWSDSNGVDLGPASPNESAENYLWIKTEITVQPIPEPATIIVWSLLGVGSWLGMRVVRRRRGGPVGRQPWSPENRQAIHDIIARGARR
jgi:hypothetical protein